MAETPAPPTADDREVLSNEDVARAGLDDWRVLVNRLHARFVSADYVTAAQFVTAITEVAEAANHHPEVRLSYGKVDIALTSHDVGALTRRDVKLARQISDLAADRRLTALPGEVMALELGLDATDFEAVGRFWSAVLTGSPDRLVDGHVVEGDGTLPTLWLQRTPAHEEPRQRFHLDLWLPPEQVPGRIDAAVAAGGAVVDVVDTFTVLADPEGNKVCLCVSEGR